MVIPIARGERVVARIPTRLRRRSCRRSSSSTPNTARRITSSVIACMLGWSGNGRPTGHEATSRSVASAITAS